MTVFCEIGSTTKETGKSIECDNTNIATEPCLPNENEAQELTAEHGAPSRNMNIIAYSSKILGSRKRLEGIDDHELKNQKIELVGPVCGLTSRPTELSKLNGAITQYLKATVAVLRTIQTAHGSQHGLTGNKLLLQSKHELLKNARKVYKRSRILKKKFIETNNVCRNMDWDFYCNVREVLLQAESAYNITTCHI